MHGLYYKNADFFSCLSADRGPRKTRKNRISNAETHAVYIRTHAYTYITIYAGAYNTPMSIYYYLF